MAQNRRATNKRRREIHDYDSRDTSAMIDAEMAGCSADPNESVNVADVIGQHFANSTHPVVMGIPSGHGVGSATLPLGLRVRLAGQRLSFLESPFGDG